MSKRLSWLVGKYGEQAQNALPHGTSTSQHHAVEVVTSGDPTSTRRYSQWLLDRFCKKQIAYEDLYKAEVLLAAFVKGKSRIADTDINAYDDLSALYSAVEPFLEGEPHSSREERHALSTAMHSTEHTCIIHDGAEYKIVMPLTVESSCFHGRGTQWCTAASIANNAFTAYSDIGALYVILDRKSGKKFQYFHPSVWFSAGVQSQLRDVNDRALSVDGFFAVNERLATAISDGGGQLVIDMIGSSADLYAALIGARESISGMSHGGDALEGEIEFLPKITSFAFLGIPKMQAVITIGIKSGIELLQMAKQNNIVAFVRQ